MKDQRFVHSLVYVENNERIYLQPCHFPQKNFQTFIAQNKHCTNQQNKAVDMSEVLVTGLQC